MTSDFGKSNDVVTYDELKVITGYDIPHKVAECLRNQNIKFLIGKHGRPWTTLGAFELAMGATVIQSEFETGVAKERQW